MPGARGVFDGRAERGHQALGVGRIGVEDEVAAEGGVGCAGLRGPPGRAGCERGGKERQQARAGKGPGEVHDEEGGRSSKVGDPVGATCGPWGWEF